METGPELMNSRGESAAGCEEEISRATSGEANGREENLAMLSQGRPGSAIVTYY